MRIATRMKVLLDPRWRKTSKPGVFSTEDWDGTRSYLATGTERRSIDIANPLTISPIWVERRAPTFEEACALQAKAEAAERKRQRTNPQSRPQRLGEKLMAGKWFEYWVRR